MNSDFIVRFLHRISNRTNMDGIEVGILGHGKADSQVIRNKVEAALSLIQQYDPRRYAYLKRDVRRILVFGSPGFLGRWHQGFALCELTDSFVLASEITPAIIAATIAHEAMHARLCRWGFGYEEERRIQIERICFKAAIAFAHHLPESEGESRSVIIEVNMRQIKRDPTFWTDLGRIEAMMDNLRQLNCPKWLISSLRWWRQKRLQHQRSGKILPPH